MFFLFHPALPLLLGGNSSPFLPDRFVCQDEDSYQSPPDESPSSKAWKEQRKDKELLSRRPSCFCPACLSTPFTRLWKFLQVRGPGKRPLILLRRRRLKERKRNETKQNPTKLHLLPRQEVQGEEGSTDRERTCNDIMNVGQSRPYT